jgi:tetratricopeptide (TPR) repeat protein
VFYDYLLKGYPFGDAVKEARIATYHLHKDRTNTWAAYQCYGDPAYRLVAMQSGGLRAVDKLVDIEEALAEIRKLSGAAKTTSAEGIASLREALVVLMDRIEKDCPAWLHDSIVQEALGEAFGEVFWFDKAIEYYQLALGNSKSGASIRTIEQLANLHIRLAVKAFENDPGRYKDSKASIEAQIHTLTSLMKTVGETPERLSMVGSGYKRLACISAGRPSRACDLALEKMESAYRHAWDLAPHDPYPLANFLAAEITRLLRSNDPEGIKKSLPALSEGASMAARLAESARLDSPDDFWASIGATDASLTSTLVDYLRSGAKALEEERFDGLVSEYTRSWKRFGSARELNSVVEHYAFLTAVLKDASAHARLCGRLEKMLLTLSSLAE